MKKKEPLHIAGGNTNSYSYCGKHYGVFQKLKTDLSNCISYFPHCCDRILHRNNSRGKRFVLVERLEVGIVHHGRKGMWWFTETADTCYIVSKRKQRVKGQKQSWATNLVYSHHSLPLPRLHFLKVPQCPKQNLQLRWKC